MDYKKLIKVEPYWNVNITSKASTLKTNEIKVEPYWNVNNLSNSSSSSSSSIKVEPYWNVNSYVWQET